MQTQDNVKVLMKFPSVLTFSNATRQAWFWEGMHCFPGEHTQPTLSNPARPRDNLCHHSATSGWHKESCNQNASLTKQKERKELDAKNQRCQWWEFPEAIVNMQVIIPGQAVF